MSPVLEKALTELQKCPEWEQEAIAQHILEDIEEYADITPELLAEWERRADELDAHPGRGIPLDAAISEILAELKKK